MLTAFFAPQHRRQYEASHEVIRPTKAEQNGCSAWAETFTHLNTPPGMPLDFHIAEGFDPRTLAAPVFRMELAEHDALFSGFTQGAYPGALRLLSDYYSDADFSGALLKQLIHELRGVTSSSAHPPAARRVAFQLLEIAETAHSAGHVLRAVAD